MLKRFLFFVAILALLLVSPAGHMVTAQDDPLSLTAEVGFDGYCKKGEWIPVRVTVANSGPDVEGFIEVEQSDTSLADRILYRVPISLPGQSRKTVTLYVEINQFQGNLGVELVEGSQVLARDVVLLSSVDSDERLYAFATGEPVDMAFLERIAFPDLDSRVAYISLDELPALGLAWGSLDLLILNDVDTASLSPAQLAAMKEWLNVGGHLVVTGGPNWRKSAAGLDDLLPVELQGAVSLYALDALTSVAQAGVEGGPFLVAKGQVREGVALLSQDDLPLWVRRDLGLGRVDWLALDLALAPLRNWSGNEHFWSMILSDLGWNAGWDNTSVNSWAAREAITSIPSLTLPSTLQMVGFLLLYTLLIGPINYWVLQRLGRRELAWFTIPALVVLFSVLAYSTGFQLRGGDVILNRLSIVSGAVGGDTAGARTLLGVFSPGRETYDIFFPSEVLVNPLPGDAYGGLSSRGSVTIEQGGATVLRRVQIDVGRVQGFQAISSVPAPLISAQLKVDPERTPHLTGSIRSQADFNLEHVGIWLGDQVFELGDLAPGETLQVNEWLCGGRATRSSTGGASGGIVYSGYVPPAPHYVDLDQLVGGHYYGGDQKYLRRHNLLRAFLTEGQLPVTVVLFAWSEQPLWEVRVEGRDSQVIDTVGYFLELPLDLAETREQVRIPPGLTTWLPLEFRGSDLAPYNLYLTSEWASFQFQPWSSFKDLQVEELVLNVSASNLRDSVRFSMWSWVQESWVLLQEVHAGSNSIPEPERFLGPENVVRLQVENTGVGTASLDVDLTYQGVMP